MTDFFPPHSDSGPDSAKKRRDRPAFPGSSLEQQARAALQRDCGAALLSALEAGASLRLLEHQHEPRLVRLLGAEILHTAAQPSAESGKWPALHVSLHALRQGLSAETAQRVLNFSSESTQPGILATFTLYGAPRDLIQQSLALGARFDACCTLAPASADAFPAEPVRDVSVLQLALCVRHFEAALTLLESGAKHQHPKSLGERALHCLFRQRFPLSALGQVLLERLLAGGASPLEETRATRGGDRETVWERMLEAGDAESFRTCARHGFSSRQQGWRDCFETIASHLDRGVDAQLLLEVYRQTRSIAALLAAGNSR